MLSLSSSSSNSSFIATNFASFQFFFFTLLIFILFFLACDSKSQSIYGPGIDQFSPSFPNKNYYHYSAFFMIWSIKFGLWNGGILDSFSNALHVSSLIHGHLVYLSFALSFSAPSSSSLFSSSFDESFCICSSYYPYPFNCGPFIKYSTNFFSKQFSPSNILNAKRKVNKSLSFSNIDWHTFLYSVQVKFLIISRSGS